MHPVGLALLLVLPAATGCVVGHRAETYADEHLDRVTGMEVRMGNATHRLDPATEPGRSLALASLEAVFHVEEVHKQSFGGEGVGTSLQESRWVHLERAPGTELALPNAERINDTVQPEDVYVIWESDALDGNLALDGERIQAETTTSVPADRIRDLAVEVLHKAGRAPGPG